MTDSQPTVAYTQRALQRVIDAKFGILLDMSKHYQRAQINFPDSPELQFLEQLVSPSIDGAEDLNLADQSAAQSLLKRLIGNAIPIPIWAHVASGVLDLMGEGEWPSLTCMGLALRTERSESPIGIFLNNTGVHRIGDYTVSPPVGCRTFLDSFYRLTREIVTSETRFAEFEQSLPGLLHYGIRLTNHAVEDHPSGSSGYYVNINLDDIQQRFDQVGNGIRGVPAQHGDFVKYLVRNWLFGEGGEAADRDAIGAKQIALYREYLSTLTTGSSRQDLKFDTYLIPALAWIRNPREFAVSANCYFAFTETLSEHQALLLFSWTQSMLTGLAQFSSINDITRQEQLRKKELLEIEQHKNIQLRRLVEQWSGPFNKLSAITREITAIVAPPSQLLLSQYQSLVTLFDPQTMLRIGERAVFQIAHEPDDYKKDDKYPAYAARLVLAVALGRIFNLNETEQKTATWQSYVALVGHTIREYRQSKETSDPLVRLSQIVDWLVCGHAPDEHVDQLLLLPASNPRCISALTLLKRAIVSGNKLDDPKWPLQGIMLALLGSPTHFKAAFSFTKGRARVETISYAKNGSYHVRIHPGDSPLTCPDILVFLSEISNYAADHRCKIASVEIKATADTDPLNCEIAVAFENTFYRGASDSGIGPERFEQETIPRTEFTARGDFTGMFQRLFSRIVSQVDWQHTPSGNSSVNFVKSETKRRFSVVVEERGLRIAWSQNSSS